MSLKTSKIINKISKNTLIKDFFEQKQPKLILNAKIRVTNKDLDKKIIFHSFYSIYNAL